MQRGSPALGIYYLPPPTPTPVLCLGNIDLQEQFTGSQGCFATNVQLGAVLKADMEIQISALTSGLALALLNRFPSKLV